MNRFLLLLLFVSMPAIASPASDAQKLLNYLSQSRALINEAGRRGDDVALEQIRAESIRRDDAWPTGFGYDRYRTCHQALVDQINFLQAYVSNDHFRRDQANRSFRDDREACQRALR